MKKIKTLGFLVTVLSFLGLTACGGNEVSNPINSEVPAPTESSEIIPSSKPSEHVHTLEHHEAVAATCETAGNIEYWTCTKCHKNFSDSEGKNEVIDVTVAALGHTLEHHEAVEATCETAGNIEYWTCTKCHKNYSDAEGKNEVSEVVVPALGHILEHHEAVETTCETAGNIEYWTCTKCHKNYSDAEGKNEVNEVVVPALGHTLERHEAVEATYLTNGNIEYWSCTKCHKLFVDANGSNEVTNVIIPMKTEVLTKDDLLEAINQLEYVKLNANITCDLVISEGKNVTLDLNGYTLTNEKDHTITNNGNLTIVGKGTIDNVTHKKAALYNSVTGVMVVTGDVDALTIERSLEDGKDNTYYAILNQGEMTINEAIVLQNGNYSSLLDNGWYDGSKNTTKKEAVLVINGGTFDGGLNTIKNDDWGNLTITGGSFKNMTQSVILNWNIAVVENAELSFKEGTSTSVAYILNGKLDDVMDQGIISIKNVKFASAEYKKLGYIYGDNAGEITVYDAEVLKSAVEIGLKVTVKLGCDITCDEEIVTPENVTIDLNGHTLN